MGRVCDRLIKPIVPVCCFAALLASASAAHAQISILSARADTASNVLSVGGGPFASGLRVFLFLDALTELPVAAVTGSQAVATLPPSIPPGTYLLVVYQPATGKGASFNTTIGAVGPVGPSGPAGRDGNLQSVTAADGSVSVLNAAGPNPLVMVAPNGITNAKIADSALSPAKIAGTAATLGPNLFTGSQVFNGAVGIGAAPGFNLHVVGAGRAEARVQTTDLAAPAVLSLSSPSLTGPHVFALEQSGAQLTVVDRSVPAQPRALLAFDQFGRATLGQVAVAQAQLTVADGGIGTALHAASATGVAARFDGQVEVNGGVQTNGGGFKHLRAPYSFPAMVGCIQFDVAWKTPFRDPNYTVSATVVQQDQFPRQLGVSVIGKTAAVITLYLCNDYSFPISSIGTVDLMAIHD